jgi:enoyl-CoA hydratase/carnithine racemase
MVGCAEQEDAPMGDLVGLERPREGVALITVTNPEINNHGSWQTVEQLASALTEAREGGARVAVLASGVPGHWIEHAWLRDLHNMVTGGPTTGDGAGWFKTLAELARPELVSIAAISGDCSGGGAELGWACDLRIAEEQACFGQPEVMIGLATGIGGTSRLARLIGRTVTAEMVLDGSPLPARRIYELGGLNRVVAEGKATETALAWAKRLAERPAGSLEVLKQMLAGNDDRHLSDALANEQTLFQGVATTPEAIARMAEIQERFDAGESIRSVYGEPRD